MTYAQLRRHLSTVARFGDEGAPTSAFPVGRWLEMRGAGCVVFVGCDRWTLTALAFAILEHRRMRRRDVNNQQQRSA